MLLTVFLFIKVCILFIDAYIIIVLKIELRSLFKKRRIKNIKKNIKKFEVRSFELGMQWNYYFIGHGSTIIKNDVLIYVLILLMSKIIILEPQFKKRPAEKPCKISCSMENIIHSARQQHKIWQPNRSGFFLIPKFMKEISYDEKYNYWIC